MLVTWVTQPNTTEVVPVVRYGSTKQLGSKNQGSTETYTDGGWDGLIHKATMHGLEPQSTFYYQLGDGDLVSEVLSFRTPVSADGRDAYKLAVTADMGVYNSSGTRSDLVEALPDIDLVVHVGDISYADGNQTKWDEYMNLFQPILSQRAYMVGVGNHEHAFNFSSYLHRFAMPQSSGSQSPNLWYSFDL